MKTHTNYARNGIISNLIALCNNGGTNHLENIKWRRASHSKLKWLRNSLLNGPYIAIFSRFDL